MKKSLRIGISFGMVSGVLTTLGLLIGLSISTESQVAVVGGVLTIAIADALSDALGIHLSQESIGKSNKQIWESTIATFISKFSFALTFTIPVLLLPLHQATIVSAVWGLLLVSFLSYRMADKEEDNVVFVVGEHIILFLLVTFLSYFVGKLVGILFI